MRAKENFDRLYNMKKRLIRYITTRWSIGIPCLLVLCLYKRLSWETSLFRTWSSVRTMRVRRKAQSTWRASLSRQWSFRRPSTISTVMYLAPVLLLRRFVVCTFEYMRVFLLVRYFISPVFLSSFQHQAFPQSFSSLTWHVELLSFSSGEHQNNQCYRKKTLLIRS